MSDNEQKQKEEQTTEESRSFVQIVESNLMEAAGIPDMRVRLIEPGWGSSGYYSPKLLSEAAAGGEFNNKHMYWDHRSAMERRERSLRNFVGVTAPSGAKYEENGPKGAGVYANVSVIPSYAEAVEAMAPHIGLSIVGGGEAAFGTEEGRRGQIFHTLAIESIDYVTRPGAGGAIVEEFNRHSQPEGKRTEESKPMPTNKPSANIWERMVEQTPNTSDFPAAFQSAVEAILKEAGLTEVVEAVNEMRQEQTRGRHLIAAESAVRGTAMPTVMQARVMESLASDQRFTEANADPAAIANEVIEREMRYAQALNPTIGVFHGGFEESGDVEKIIEENLAAIFGPDDDDDNEGEG